MNTVNLIGRLVKEPEIRTTETNKKVLNFTIAVNRKYKNSDGSNTTDFINCVAWEKRAELIEKYFKKGSKIGILGTIQTRKWTNQEGKNRYNTEILIMQIDFLENKEKTEEQILREEIEELELPFDIGSEEEI